MKFTPLSSSFCKCKGNVFGCLSGVLNRILCSKTFSNHSSKRKIQHNLLDIDKLEDSEQSPRAKAALSFKETVDFIELEDDDFFVVSIDDKPNKKKSKKKKKGCKFKNSMMGVTGQKMRGRRDKYMKKQRKNRDEESKDIVFSNEERVGLKISARNPRKLENSVDGSKDRKKEKKESKEDEEEECESDNSSPVSVLDHREFISDAEATTTVEEDATLRSGKDCAREEFPYGYDQSNGRETTRSGCKERKIWLRRRNCFCKKHDNLQMLSRICKLTAAEIHNSQWKYKGMSITQQDLEDVGQVIGLLIFDGLVSELFDLLSLS